MEIRTDSRRSGTISHDPLECRAAGGRGKVPPGDRSVGETLPKLWLPALCLPSSPELWFAGRAATRPAFLREAPDEKCRWNQWKRQIPNFSSELDKPFSGQRKRPLPARRTGTPVDRERGRRSPLSGCI